MSPSAILPRQAVVAIIPDRDRLLTIKRSKLVRAPGEFCFPGGGIEQGETIEQAIEREMMEELGVLVQPVRPVWCSRALSGVELFWWQVDINPGQTIRPNREEVAEVHWLKMRQIRRLPNLLASNVAFFASLDRREFSLDFAGSGG